MPQPTSPPYVEGAQTQPRQLVRWLDVNPQNGPLTRYETFITLPAFSVNVNWKGYSEIVAAFNFEGPNNFSLLSILPELPTTPNYALAISWRTTSGVVHRYFLWGSVGEVIYFPEIFYSAQVIKKNFRFEIWSTNNSPAIQTTALNFYTSVLGNVDYRYSNDQPLVLADAIVTNFQNINAPTIALPSDIGIAYWWQPSGIQISSGISSWIDSIANNSLVPIVGNPTLGTAPNGAHAMNSSSNALNSNFTSFNQTFNTIAFGFQAGASGNLLSDANNDNVIFYNGAGTLTLKNQGVTIVTVTGIISLSWYVVVVAVNTLYVYNMQTGILLGSGSGAATIGTATTIQYGGNGRFFIDLIFGLNKATALDARNIANYFSYVYYSLGMTLPLTFPTNALSQAN